MPLKTLVKASAVTNLTDARFFAAAGAELLGFCFDSRLTDYIEPKQANEILNWIEGPKIVAETASQNINEINALVDELGIDFIQLRHQFHSAAFPLINAPVIQEIIIDSSYSENKLSQSLEITKNSSAYVLLNFTEHQISWEKIKSGEFLYAKILRQACSSYRIILDLDFTVKNVSEIISSIQPAGINIQGGREEKTGIKDFDEISRILELLEEKG